MAVSQISRVAASEEAEEWRAVVGYEGLYEVSSLGRVRSLERITEMGGRSRFSCRRQPARMLTIYRDNGGYLRVNINKDGISRKRLVHRLVCEAWHGPPPPGCTDAAHNDGNPGNPKPDNLRWDTRKGNMVDCRKHGTYRHGEDHQSAKLSDDQVTQIRESLEPATTIASRYGVHPNYVYDLRNMRKRT